MMERKWRLQERSTFQGSGRISGMYRALTRDIEVVVEPFYLEEQSDPDDDRFLECALAANAAYLVTGNVRHFPKDYKPIQIVAPRQLLNRLIEEFG